MAVWLTSAGSQDTATWCMGPSAMERPASFLRAPQYTLILVRTGNPNRVFWRELEGEGEVSQGDEVDGGLRSGLAVVYGIAAD